MTYVQQKLKDEIAFSAEPTYMFYMFDRRITRRIALVLVLALFASGCATRTVSIRSEPPGAKVTIADQESTTPCVLKVPRKTRTARLKLEGYETTEVDLGRRPSVLWRTSHAIAMAHAKGTRYAGALLGAAGVLGVVIFADSNDDSDDDDEDEALGWTFLGFSVAAIFVGGTVIYIGEAAEESLEEVNPDAHFFELEASDER